jgi:outer membrane protein assembly factor BamA
LHPVARPCPLPVDGLRAVVLLAALAIPAPGEAIRDIRIEEDIADLLATPHPTEAPTDTAGRQWAVLPQVGFGPDTGPVGGAKFEHRNLLTRGITLDLDGTYALNAQQSYDVSIGTPHLLGDRFLAAIRGSYHHDPQFDYFGLGNNDVGPDPASTHSLQRSEGFGSFGWRPYRTLALNLSVGLRHVRIGRGERDDDRPFTLDASPDLPGLEGGMVNPLEASLVWTTRNGVVRPTRGWRVILKVSHTNQDLLSDFEFTRWVLDAGYLYPLFGGRHVLGIRVNGGFIFGPQRQVPFWELEELGGDDTLRGFFPHRFRGTQRVLANAEYRAKLTAFDFFDLWHVQVDGVIFGEGGRVFIDREELRDEFRLNRDLLDRIVSDFKYSYGGGLRFALSQALEARVDVGFSEEEQGLVYLAFSQAF